MAAIGTVWLEWLTEQAPCRLKKGLSLVLRIDLFSPQWGYIFRSALAAALALGIGFVCQVETPYSAATTVLLVANANQGAVLAKGTWRVIGTLIGGLVAILLMGFSAQTPALFVLGFALWLGLCTGGAMIFRHFRASGAAVAGYTIGLATYGSLEHPDTSLEHALGRVATVVLGVVCLGVVTALLSARATPPKLDTSFARLIAAVGRFIAARLPGEAKPDTLSAVGLVPDLFALDDLLELASAESAEVALRAGTARDGMAALFASLVGASGWQSAEQPHPLIATAAIRIREPLDAVSEAVARPAGAEVALRLLEAVRHDLKASAAEAERLESADGLDVLIQIDRLVEMIEDYEYALVSLTRLRSKRLHRIRRIFRFHRDWRAGLDNGLRSVLAIIIGGVFWIATGWSGGTLMLLVLAPYCVLLAMTSNPAGAAVEFVKGTVVAVPTSFVCAFLILPLIDGFPLLIAALAPFWIAGLYATTKPKYAAAALAYLVAFNTLVGANNPMTFNMASWCNQVCGWLAGVIVTLLCFRLLLPRDPMKEARRIVGAIRNDVFAVARSTRPVDRLAWEHLQHHRLSRIALTLKSDPVGLRPIMEDGFAGLQVGRALLRIRNALNQPDFPAWAQTFTRAALRDLQDRGTTPAGAANHLRATAAQLLCEHDGDTSARRLVHRVASALMDIGSLLDAHAAFFAFAGGRRC